MATLYELAEELAKFIEIAGVLGYTVDIEVKGGAE